MSLDKKKGFTLVELLVVAGVIAMLVGLLLPHFARVIQLGKRVRCSKNIKEIVRGSLFYAGEDKNHPNTTKQALPVAAGINSNWADSATGNRACMWLLIEYGYIDSPGVFICPSLPDYRAADKSEGAFQNNTCGYSFISMVARTPTSYPPTLTTNNATGSMIIVGDLNPRFTADSSVPDVAMLQSNSKSHGKSDQVYEGQNVGRIDGSGVWLDSPRVLTGTSNDWIYQSAIAAQDNEGKCRHPYDVFLAP